LEEQYVIVVSNAQQAPDPLNCGIYDRFESLGSMAYLEYRHARALKIEHFHLYALEHDEGQSSRPRIEVKDSLAHYPSPLRVNGPAFREAARSFTFPPKYHAFAVHHDLQG
jgi:hypothetical protein